MDQKFLYEEQLGSMEVGMRSFSDLIELVRQGYRKAAIPYNEQKDTSILSQAIFLHWVSIVPVGVVAELGCGSGYPVAHNLAHVWRTSGHRYIGVDLSEEQIDMAKHSLKDAENVSFTVREMTDWCRKQRDNSISGIIALFSVFHLPRSQHVELLSHIARILIEGAPFLFTTPSNASEGLQERWLGNSEMYWSSFSVNWYEVTCADLGLDFVAKSKEVKEFDREKETTYYLLYKKPVAQKSFTHLIPVTAVPPYGIPTEMMLNEEYKHLFGQHL